jgi:hypothetical protein
VLVVVKIVVYVYTRICADVLLVGEALDVVVVSMVYIHGLDAFLGFQ